jgi:hypothetical protein
MNDAPYSYNHPYQSGRSPDPSLYNNGLRPILPPSSYRSDNNRWWNQLIASCPVYVVTYITLHLDTISKILNHCIGLSFLGHVVLFLSSFSISYYDDSHQNHIGLHTVLCTFILCTISIVNLLIINNNRISALSIFAPTEYMIGVATGLTMAAVLITLLLSSTYRSARKLCHRVIQQQDTFSHANKTYTTSNDGYHFDNDPVLIDTCVHHQSTIVSLWFWSGLLIWFNIMIVVLFIMGRQELSAHTTKHQNYNYEPVVSSSTGHDGDVTSLPSDTLVAPVAHIDFEEQFRRQQQEILGAQNLQAMRDRMAATTTQLFTGDYSTIPEVTPGASPPPKKKGGTNGPQILSV